MGNINSDNRKGIFMSIYSDWGFEGQPFDHNPLGRNYLGERLLIGREIEKRTIISRLKYTNKIVTIEGEVGVGKTSLVNVASFENFNEIDDAQECIQIPCIEIFQLKPGENIQELRKKVLLKLAETIVRNSEYINTKMEKTIEKFFSPELVTSVSGGLSVLGCGIDGGTSHELNDTQVFNEEGFYSLVIKILKDSFKGFENSGIVCMIDNLELIRDNDEVRDLLEEMRDVVFNIPGTKWVLCGANHIFRSLVRSQRLQGYMHDPIVVNPLSISVIPTVLDARIREYSTGTYYLPFTDDEFCSLYRILKGVTRAIFDMIDKYCNWVFETHQDPETDEEKEDLFGVWLRTVAIGDLVDIVHSERCVLIERYYSVCHTGEKINEKEYVELFNHNSISYESFKYFVEKYGLMKLEGDFLKHQTKGAFLKFYFDEFDSFSELCESTLEEFNVDLGNML